MLGMSGINRFRHAQTDSETLDKLDFCPGINGILNLNRQDLTRIQRRFDSDPTRTGGQTGGWTGRRPDGRLAVGLAVGPAAGWPASGRYRRPDRRPSSRGDTP